MNGPRCKTGRESLTDSHFDTLAGLEYEIPEPGDTQVLDIGNSSVIVLRDDDMQVRAFHNTCRHRGARILDAGQAVISKLVCPYHQWTYEPFGPADPRAPHGRGFRQVLPQPQTGGWMASGTSTVWQSEAITSYGFHFGREITRSY